MAEEIRIPSLGESVTEATVAKWLKQVGDEVDADEPVAELETDKVAMEVNAPSAGVISELVVDEGETVEVGTLIARMDSNGAAGKPKEAKKPEQKEESETDEEAPDQAEEDEAEEDEAEEDGADEGGGEMVDIVVPESGESVTEADLAQWLKKEGEAVDQDEAVAELETDKAAMEINAPAAGVLAEVLIEEGATVSPGDVIGRIEKGAKAGKAKEKKKEKADAGKAKEKAKEKAGDGKTKEKDKAEDRAADREGARAQDVREMQPMAPAVRRLIADYNLDPASIKGSGKDGRLTKGDVLKAIETGEAKTFDRRDEASATPAPAVVQEEEGPREERMPMTRMRKRIAERLKDAQNTAAMLTTFNDVDMSAVMAARKKYRDLFEKKHGIRLGFMSFFAKAAVLALREIPQVNARIDGDEIVYQNFYDIGIAVSAPQGLVVPVVRDVDKLSFADTELKIAEFGKKARDGKLSVNELTGGTFTLTNGGIFGSLISTPIINPPQSAILGMHRIEERPVAVNGAVEIRPMMYLALSYDHRLIDGREAVTFLVRMKEAIEDPQRLLLDL